MRYVPSRYGYNARVDDRESSSLFLDSLGLAWGGKKCDKLMGNSTWFRLNYGIINFGDDDSVNVSVKDAQGVTRLHVSLRFGQHLPCAPLDFEYDEAPPVWFISFVASVAFIVVALVVQSVRLDVLLVVVRQVVSIFCGFLFYVGYYVFFDGWSSSSSAGTLLRTRLDDAIPFVPEAVFLYVSLYLMIFLPVFVIKDTVLFLRAAFVFCAFNLLGTFVFVLFPVQMIRGTVVPDASFSMYVTDLVYWIDPPTNNFPSLHCANVVFISLLCSSLDPVLSWILLPYSALIIVSTLLVKQHWIADALAGALYGWISFRLAAFPRISPTYSRWRLMILIFAYALMCFMMYEYYWESKL